MIIYLIVALKDDGVLIMDVTDNLKEAENICGELKVTHPETDFEVWENYL